MLNTTSINDKEKDKNKLETIKNLSFDQDLLKYDNELKEDLTITKVNIKEKALRISYLRCKWLQYLHFEKDLYKKIKEKKEIYIKKKINSNSTSLTDPLLKLKNTETINNDEIMVKLNKYLEETKNRIEWLERVQDIMKDFVWDIKNQIELYKLERI